MVWCDAGYQGVHRREENLGREVGWQVAMRPEKRRGLEPGSEEPQAEKLMASVSAKVEHPFLNEATLRLCQEPTLALLLGLGNLMTTEGHQAGKQ